MFNKEKFAQVIKKILDQYESGVEFSEKSGVNRTYISKYINISLDKAPSPAILKKIANNSKDVTNYAELMLICGHIENDIEGVSDETFSDYLEKMTSLNEEESTIIKEILSHTELLQKNKPYELINIFNNLVDNSDLSLDSQSKIIKAFKSFLISMKEHVDYKTTSSINPTQIPVIGKISAGQPILAEENFQGYEFAPSTSIKEDFDYFYLKVKGDSMNLKFNDGDLVLVQKQENLENGEIGVIRVNGYDATVKKFKRQGDFIILEPMSTNSEHEIKIYTSTDELHIIGKVVSYMGKIN